MNRIIYCLLLCLVSCGLYAQPKINSPYSRAGLGELSSSDFASSQSLGRLSAVYHTFFESNLANPASLGFLQYTSFQIGMGANYSNLKFNDTKSSNWSGNLDHLSLGIPLINPINELLERRETDFSWGMNFSISPFSTVGYDIESFDTIDSIGQVRQNFVGEGGTYKVMWGNGWKYKNLSAGLNLGYLYGREDFLSTTDFLEVLSDYNNVNTRSSTYKGFIWNAGLIYEHPLDREAARSRDESPSKLLSVGITFSSAKSFNTSSDFYNIALNQGYFDADTTSQGTNIKGNGVLPSEFSIGILYHQASKYKVGLNYTSESWGNYENDAKPNDELRNSFRIGGGIGWLPDANSITSYWKRVEYRLGFNYEKDPRVFSNEQLSSFGIHFGAGMPFFLQRQISWLNLGLELGRRGTPNGIKENYLRIKMGVTLNDNQWFIKRKYN